MKKSEEILTKFYNGEYDVKPPKRNWSDVKDFFLRILFPSYWDDYVWLSREFYKQNRVLAEAYKVLDRIAMMDDAPSKELSEMARIFILENGLTVKYKIQSIDELFDKSNESKEK